MDIALTANAGCIAQSGGDRFHHTDDRSFGMRRRSAGIFELERLRGEQRGGPGAKIFRSEVFSGDFVQVFIDVGRTDRLAPAFVVEVLKQVLAGQVLAFPDNVRQARICQIDLMLFSALTAESKANRRAMNVGMAIPKRGQAKRSIRARIFIVSNANQRVFQEADQCGENLLSRHPRKLQVPAYSAADARKRGTEQDHVRKFRLVADGSPARVIEVLFPSPRVSPGRLDMATRR